MKQTPLFLANRTGEGTGNTRKKINNPEKNNNNTICQSFTYIAEFC